jgi:hypothetical protein
MDLAWRVYDTHQQVLAQVHSIWFELVEEHGL